MISYLVLLLNFVHNMQAINLAQAQDVESRNHIKDFFQGCHLLLVCTLALQYLQ